MCGHFPGTQSSLISFSPLSVLRQVSSFLRVSAVRLAMTMVSTDGTCLLEQCPRWYTTVHDIILADLSHVPQSRELRWSSWK